MSDTAAAAVSCAVLHRVSDKAAAAVSCAVLHRVSDTAAAAGSCAVLHRVSYSRTIVPQADYVMIRVSGPGGISSGLDHGSWCPAGECKFCVCARVGQ